MNTKLLILLISILLTVSCEKDKYENTGTITGQDLTMCACCGGYFIDINGTQYRFDKSTLPADFNFEDNQLPLSVELDWDSKTDACKDFKWITISKIRKK